MDVHKDSITLAVLPDGAPAPTRVDRLPNDLGKLRRYCERLAEQGEFRACYEASGAGYVLQREMRQWGYACDVIAPSLIPIKPGVQRKHDKHDAVQLARLHRAGELTAVRIPSALEERVRDVVRCRETFQREILKSRHYILKFLARRGFVYRDGQNWSLKHLAWLRSLAAVSTPLAREDALVFRIGISIGVGRVSGERTARSPTTRGPAGAQRPARRPPPRRFGRPDGVARRHPVARGRIGRPGGTDARTERPRA